MEKIKQLKQMIDQSKRIVFFTGAGISVPSGIPDFRSATGLYKKNLRTETILSKGYFYDHTDQFYDFYKKNMVFPEAKPNIAHQWIAELEALGKDIYVVTQNIDGLHQIAGSSNVVELHGSIHRNHCIKCGKAYRLDTVLNCNGVPKCECGGIIKPDVVLYDEALNSDDIDKAISWIANSGCMVVVGTSLNVYPAAGFIYHFRGTYFIVLNKGGCEKAEWADLIIDDDIAKIVESLKKD